MFSLGSTNKHHGGPHAARHHRHPHEIPVVRLAGDGIGGRDLHRHRDGHGHLPGATEDFWEKPTNLWVFKEPLREKHGFFVVFAIKSWILVLSCFIIIKL